MKQKKRENSGELKRGWQSWQNIYSYKTSLTI